MRIRFLVSTLVLLFFAGGPANADYFGIPPDEFRQHYRAQRDTLWCWAASVEMVLATQDVDVPHEVIVEYIRGFAVNAPGGVDEMAKAINGIHRDAEGRAVMVAGQPVPGAPNPAVLIIQMKNRKPTILAYQGGPGIGHAVVLFGIDAEIDTETGSFFITRLHVADPYPIGRVAGRYQSTTVFDEDRFWHRTYSPRVVRNGPWPWQQAVGIDVGMITSVTLVTGTVVDD